MPGCAVFGCSSNTSKKVAGVKFYSFPTDPALRQKWVLACARKGAINVKSARVCSNHFTPDQKKKSLMNSLLQVSPKKQRNIVDDAVPVRNLPKSSTPKKSDRQKRKDDKEWRNDREKLVENILQSDCLDNVSENMEVEVAGPSGDSILVNPLYPPTTQPSSSSVTVNLSNPTPISIARRLNFCSENIDVEIGRPSDDAVLADSLDPPTKPSAGSIAMNLSNPPYISVSTRLEDPPVAGPSGTPSVRVMAHKPPSLQDMTNVYKDYVKLTKQLQQQTQEIKLLKDELKKKNDHDCCQILLSRYFSPGVVRKMTAPNPKKRIRWAADDIASAISLRAVSPQAYKYLIKVMGLPLPSTSTLKAWARKTDLYPGLLVPVLKLIGKKAKNMTPMEKVAVISFDEMEISKTICFDKRNEEVLGPHKKVQTVFIRGLFSKWKQVIYYNFDTPMTKELFCTIIQNVSDAGLKIVASVCDQGPENRGLATKLGVSVESPFFSPLPDQNEKVFFFYDAPHLFKSLRNHFIDEGYIINGKTVSKRCFLKILDAERKGQINDLTVAYKIKQEYLQLQNRQRQNVKKATKLLSHTNAMAIKFLAEKGIIDDQSWEAVSNFIELMNNWFDLFNSVDKFKSYSASAEQDALIEQCNAIMKNMRKITPTVGKKDSALLPFQNGILISNRALQCLLKYIQDEVLPGENITYIMTRRLNQDILENFFSHIRRLGVYNTHPDPLDLISRFRWYILGKDSHLVAEESLNTELDRVNTNALADLSQLTAEMHPDKSEAERIILTQELFDDIVDCQPITKHLLNPLLRDVDETELEVVPDFEDLSLDPLINEFSEPSPDLSVSYIGGRDYIAGYVAFRVKDEFPHLGIPTCESTSDVKSWTSYVSKGHLYEPTEEMKRIIAIADDEFIQFHGKTELQKGKKVFEKLLTNIKNRLGSSCTVSDKVLHLFIRTRTFIRLRSWNDRIIQATQKQEGSRQSRSNVNKLNKYKK